MTWISIPGPKHTFLLVAVQPESSIKKKSVLRSVNGPRAGIQAFSSGCVVVCQQKSPGFNFWQPQTDDPSA